MTKTPIVYYGGKQTMLPYIMPLIPAHSVYTEAFAGGAPVMFAKEPVRVNVINDLNGELINFYRTAVADFEALNKEIQKTLHCREQHRVASCIYTNPDYFTRVQRAWALWYLSKTSFSGILDGSFSVDKIKGKALRVNNAKAEFTGEIKAVLEHCTIEQDDAFNVIRRFDTPESFHFIDPPYVGCNMGHYKNMFTDADLIRLLELLSGLKGKFMLTMYPNQQIADFAARNDWHIHPVTRRVTAANSSIKRKQEEWMIVNYAVGNG